MDPPAFHPPLRTITTHHFTLLTQVRAKQYYTDDFQRIKTLPILLHGDGAFSGQVWIQGVDGGCGWRMNENACYVSPFCSQNWGPMSPVPSFLLHPYPMDALSSSQGIVYETLDMSGLIDYTVGGTVHIVVNNQV